MGFTVNELKLYRASFYLAGVRYLLSTIMNEDDTLTDKEYNSIREAHDSIASAHDAINRLINQKD